MEKKNKLLIVTSCLALLAAGGVAVGVTSALFTQKGTAQVHINSGDLKVGFYLSSLIFDQLDPKTGEIQTEQVVDLKTTTPYSSCWDETNGGVDLAKFAGNVVEVEKFYPTMKGSAIFKVVNGSDIAVNTKIEKTQTGKFAPVAPDTEGVAMTDEEVKQLDTKFTWLDSSSQPIEEDTVKITKGQSANALLTFEFLSKDTDGSNDNKYQGCSFTIDTLLTATQVVRS